MWVEALDLVLGDLRAAGVDLRAIRGVSGAGQQHGSVYLGRTIAEAGALVDARAARRPGAPAAVTQDRADLDGRVDRRRVRRDHRSAPAATARWSRSPARVAIERFTGPQIRKFWKDDPAAYERTAEIHLVSSFIASLLTGTSVPIDSRRRRGHEPARPRRPGAWNAELLDATAPGLGKKLKAPVPSAT